ncbi:MAG: DUF4139 domain-containing protein [Deltaproteobacteria bacterium]|nr:DUF4139 domain-containing protein [Deltaproteobacteria bacterium]
MKRIIGCIFCLIILGYSSSPAAGEATSTSTALDQTGVEVTVYNSNLGLIKDTRALRVPSGMGELRFMDVASSIMPVTVHVKSLNNPERFRVLEQNYEYDLMDGKKLLDKYVGRKIKIIDWNKFQDRKETVEAVLLSNNRDQIFKINNEIYIGHPGIKVLPEIPENLIAKPTLTWLYENERGETHNLEVSYLTGNINWKADYVVVLNADDTSSDISGWVTVDNKSGATYRNATLKLIAGEIHRAEQKDRSVRYAMEGMSKAGAPQFGEKEFFEYHIYDLARKTTIKDKQTKQIRLFETAGVAIEKEFLVYGVSSYFTGRYRAENPKQPVDVYVKFKNSSKNNLGMPLPEGIMRLYKMDEKGSQQFVGEDRIDHTPKDEEVTLKIGEAFDLVAEKIQTDFRQVTTRRYEPEWEVPLRNHKDSEVTVGLIEPLFGSWKVLKSSHAYKKVDAFTLRFDVKVPKDGEVKISYRIQVGL